MIEVRSSNARGQAELGWLHSRHSFSFAEYHDQQHMGFGPLRVINEDYVEPARGFGTHGHRDMEIISYVLEGELEHKDSMGNGSVIRYGDVQRMSAGTGVRHSEFNHSPSELVHFLQIWIIPDRTGIDPGYEQKHFDVAAKRGRWRLIAAGDGRDGAVTIHQDARIYAAIVDRGEQLVQPLARGRLGYVHVARGRTMINGVPLGAGDALKLRDEPQVKLDAGEPAEVLLFDLPP
jgi:hypothetical protein